MKEKIDLENIDQNNSSLSLEEELNIPNWEDVKVGKIKYQELNSDMKSKVKQEAYEETPEDKKYLWNEYGYTPPQTYNGIDRNGKRVEGLELEGFEDLVKRGRIKPKSKIEQDVENLTSLVREQNKNILAQRENEIERKLSEIKERGIESEGDFATYEKYLQDKGDIKFQKLQLDKKPEEPQNQNIDLSNQYSLDEQVAIKAFALQNKDFVAIMQRNKELEKFFDQSAIELAQKNPNASPEQILNATKKLSENAFNLNNQQQKSMFRNNFIQNNSSKTNLDQKLVTKIVYNNLSKRDQKWVDSEARSGREKYAGKTLDEVANMIYGHLLKK